MAGAINVIPTSEYEISGSFSTTFRAPVHTGTTPIVHPGQNLTATPKAASKASATSRSSSKPKPTKSTSDSAATTTSPITPVPAGYRRPRAFLVLAGQKIALTSQRVLLNGHYAASSFSLDLPLYNQPQGIDLDFWSKADPSTLLELHIGLLDKGQRSNEFPRNSTVLGTYLVDDIRPSLDKGIVSLTGRDLTARFIDNKTAERNPNQTASEIVTRWAKLFGLTPKVTATTTPVGKYYQTGYSSMTNAQPYWDVITFYAQQEGFDAYVSGTTFYFGPPPAAEDSQPFKLAIHNDGNGRLWGNVLSLEFERNANLAKDISVTVVSHNSRTGRSVRATASRAGTRTPSSSRSSSYDKVASYVIRKPGMTEEQAQNAANAMLKELSLWARAFTARLEGLPVYSPQRGFIIAGTATDFDTKYYPHSVTHEWSEQGYTCSISARNQPDPTDDAGAS